MWNVKQKNQRKTVGVGSLLDKKKTTTLLLNTFRTFSVIARDEQLNVGEKKKIFSTSVFIYEINHTIKPIVLAKLFYLITRLIQNQFGSYCCYSSEHIQILWTKITCWLQRIILIRLSAGLKADESAVMVADKNCLRRPIRTVF